MTDSQRAGRRRRSAAALDGIPLALELAAARVRALSVDAIADAPRATASGLLTGGDRDRAAAAADAARADRLEPRVC